MILLKTNRGDVNATFHFPDLNEKRHWGMMEATIPRQVIEGMVLTIEGDMNIPLVNGELDITVLGYSWERVGGALFGIKPGVDNNDEYIDAFRRSLTGLFTGFIESELTLSAEVAQALSEAGFPPGSPLSSYNMPEELLQLIARDLVDRNGKDAQCSCLQDDCRLGLAITAEKKLRNLI
jgi:hypothetical protein